MDLEQEAFGGEVQAGDNYFLISHAWATNWNLQTIWLADLLSSLRQ